MEFKNCHKTHLKINSLIKLGNRKKSSKRPGTTKGYSLDLFTNNEMLMLSIENYKTFIAEVEPTELCSFAFTKISSQK